MVTTVTISDSFLTGLVDEQSVGGRVPEVAPPGYAWVDANEAVAEFRMSGDGGIRAHRIDFSMTRYGRVQLFLPDCYRVQATVEWQIGSGVSTTRVDCGIFSDTDEFPNTDMNAPEFGGNGGTGSRTTYLDVSGYFLGNTHIQFTGVAGTSMGDSVTIKSISLELDLDESPPVYASEFWTNFVNTTEVP